MDMARRLDKFKEIKLLEYDKDSQITLPKKFYINFPINFA